MFAYDKRQIYVFIVALVILEEVMLKLNTCNHFLAMIVLSLISTQTNREVPLVLNAIKLLIISWRNSRHFLLTLGRRHISLALGHTWCTRSCACTAKTPRLHHCPYKSCTAVAVAVPRFRALSRQMCSCVGCTLTLTRSLCVCCYEFQKQLNAYYLQMTLLDFQFRLWL